MIRYNTSRKITGERIVRSGNKALIQILIIVCFFFLLLIFFAVWTMKAIQGKSGLSLDSFDKSAIAVVEIEGVIMDAKKVVEKLERAEKMKEIKAIVVRINSPGGAVGPSQEIYEEIRRIDKNIPVFASFGAIAASGGYYIGAATRKIYSNKGTLTGSIGVIMQFVDLSKLYEFAKVSPETLKAGKYKDIGQTARPMTSEERGLMEGMLKGVHKQFIDDILEVRKDRIKGKIEDLAQGQIFSGEDAYKYGLVDEIAGLWAAGRKIHEEIGLKGEFAGFKYIKDKKKISLWDLADGLDDVVSNFKLLGQSLGGVVPMFKMAI